MSPVPAATLTESVAPRILRDLGATEQMGVPIAGWSISSHPIEGYFGSNMWLPDGTSSMGDRRIDFSSPLPFEQGALTDPGRGDFSSTLSCCSGGGTGPNPHGSQEENFTRVGFPCELCSVGCAASRCWTSHIAREIAWRQTAD